MEVVRTRRFQKDMKRIGASEADVLFARDAAILLFGYSKAEQADLTQAERATVLALLKELDDGDP